MGTWIGPSCRLPRSKVSESHVSLLLVTLRLIDKMCRFAEAVMHDLKIDFRLGVNSLIALTPP